MLLFYFPFCSFLFDVNSQEHKYYKNLVKCLRDGQQAANKSDNNEAITTCGERKRKRKSRWDPTPPSSASSSSSNDAAVAAALAAAAEIEHSIPMSNREEEERQKQIREQQEVGFQNQLLRFLYQAPRGLINNNNSIYSFIHLFIYITHYFNIVFSNAPWE